MFTVSELARRQGEWVRLKVWSWCVQATSDGLAHQASCCAQCGLGDETSHRNRAICTLCSVVPGLDRGRGLASARSGAASGLRARVDRFQGVVFGHQAGSRGWRQHVRHRSGEVRGHGFERSLRTACGPRGGNHVHHSTGTVAWRGDLVRSTGLARRGAAFGRSHGAAGSGPWSRFAGSTSGGRVPGHPIGVRALEGLVSLLAGRSRGLHTASLLALGGGALWCRHGVAGFALQRR